MNNLNISNIGFETEIPTQDYNLDNRQLVAAKPKITSYLAYVENKLKNLTLVPTVDMKFETDGPFSN